MSVFRERQDETTKNSGIRTCFVFRECCEAAWCVVRLLRAGTVAIQCCVACWCISASPFVFLVIAVGTFPYDVIIIMTFIINIITYYYYVLLSHFFTPFHTYSIFIFTVLVFISSYIHTHKHTRESATSCFCYVQLF